MNLINVFLSDAYKEIKKEKPPFSSTENETELPKIEIPEDLKCSLCQYLLQDAVLIPCCGNSFCDECNFGRFLALLFLCRLDNYILNCLIIKYYYLVYCPQLSISVNSFAPIIFK